MADIIDNAAASRYETTVEGYLSIADYRRDGDKISITHIEVPEALRGRGIAAEIMAYIVRDAKARGLTIVPVCPYAASYLKRHPI